MQIGSLVLNTTVDWCEDLSAKYMSNVCVNEEPDFDFEDLDEVYEEEFKY